MKGFLRVVTYTCLLASVSGCYTTSMIEQRGFMSEGFAMPPELGVPPNNPSMIVRISPLADGTNAGGAYGARAGADVGNVATTIGGGDPLSAVVGLGVGIVASGIGAIAGAVSDGKAKNAAQEKSDLYSVLLLSAYFLEPESPMTSKEIEKTKRHGQGVYIVRFDRKDIRYAANDFIVIKETTEKVAGRKIYRAIDIFDAVPADTNSSQFLARIKKVAKEHSTNTRNGISH